MPKKILVAVHGMGDQVRCATIQLVANRVCEYFGLEPSMPLGRFSTELMQIPGQPGKFSGVWSPDSTKPGTLRGDITEVRAGAAGAFLIQSPPDPELHPDIGFGEVYWADIPRGPARDLYTLEEAKRWAHTVVARLKMFERHCRERKLRNTPDTDYDLVRSVIHEIIDGVGVSERLLYLMQKMTPLRFDLKQILVDYLGDVQLVAEYQNYRAEIVSLFQAVLAKVYEQHHMKPSVAADGKPQPAEIYVIAHSEGTVVALLGLLDAYRRKVTGQPSSLRTTGQVEWVEQVRGLMTFGSPINKHLLVWPELWTGLDLPVGTQQQPRIRWRNYYDFGDPIGFALDEARVWLKANHWDGVFEFDDPKKHDFGFSRSFLAGQAHNDYWFDNAVFGHFLAEVVQPPQRLNQAGGTLLPAPKKYGPPRSRWTAMVLGPTLPYLIPFGLLFLGVFFLQRAVIAFLSIDEGFGDNWRNSAGIALLLAGVTAAVRIPQLTREVGWRLCGLACFVGAVTVFPYVTAPGMQNRIGGSFDLARRLAGHTVYDQLRFDFVLWRVIAFLLVAFSGLIAASVIRGVLLRYDLSQKANPSASSTASQMHSGTAWVRALVSIVITAAVVVFAVLDGWFDWSATGLQFVAADSKEYDVRAALRCMLVLLGVIALGVAIAEILDRLLPAARTPVYRRLKRIANVAPALVLLGLAMAWGWFSYDPLLLFLAVVAIGGWCGYLLSVLCPSSWGAKPLILAGGVCLILFVFVRLGWWPLNAYHNYYREAKIVLAKETQFRGPELEKHVSELFRKFADEGHVYRTENKKVKTEISRFILAHVEAERSSNEPDPRWSSVSHLSRTSAPPLPPDVDQPFWPVLLFGAVFLYLWWLSAMCFDVLVVWQHYIRSAALPARLRERTPPIQCKTGVEPSHVDGSSMASSPGRAQGLSVAD